MQKSLNSFISAYQTGKTEKIIPTAEIDIVKLAEAFWMVSWHYPLNISVNTST